MIDSPTIIYVCPHCGDLVCKQLPVSAEHDGIVCAGPLGHIIMERRQDEGQACT